MSLLPFDDDAPRSQGPAWDATLTRRMRVLLHTWPILQLRAGDTRRDEDLRHYDSLALVVRTFDVIAEHMGLEREATRETVFEGLRPLLEAMDAASGRLPDRKRQLRMVDRVLAALRNDDDAHRPFQLEYQELDDSGQAVTRVLRFRLIQDAFGAAGNTVLRLSNEAINLFFNALELDIEDAQTATEAIVQSQLGRGLFTQAVRSAQNALRQSRAFRDRLARVVRETRRDIERVDWHEEIPRLIDDALAHLDQRLEAERTILASAHERLDHLEPGSENARTVARIAELTQLCMQTHMELQRELMTARATFLDSQARQSFLPVSLKPRPNLYGEVLQPLLEGTILQADQAMARGVSTLAGARRAEAFSLAQLVEGLLRPPRARGKSPLLMESMEPESVAQELARYAPSVREAAEAKLRALPRPTRISEVLDEVRGTASDDVQDVVILLALQFFETESDDSGEDPGLARAYRVDRVEGGRLRHRRFTGDDLLVTPIAPRVVPVAPSRSPFLSETSVE